MWRLPGLDALPAADRDRAYRNVGGHPRTLEYLDALLRGGQARFDDVALRMEDRLRDRGITDPAAWLAQPGRDLDASLAEAVTLSVDDVVLSGLLERLRATPVAAELVIGASVYRIPVDDTALVFQVGEPVERPPDPERQARIRRVQQAIEEAVQRADGGQVSLQDAGLSAEEYARYEADLAEERRPPVEAPAGLAAAMAAARAASLLAPVPRGDQAPLHFVHRWTAGAIAALHPDAARQAHQRAAAFWHWRVSTIPQSRQDDIDQLLEARYHHHAAGQTDQAVAATHQAVDQLRTWGQYGRAAELCRETLTWVTPGSQEDAVFRHWLGVLAQVRGDYDAAEPLYRRALEISERARGPGGHGLPATTSSAGWPSCGGTTTPPSRSTAGPWKSTSASVTRRACPRATTSSACWPSCGGTTTPPSRSTAGPWKSASASGTRRHGHGLPPARHAGPAAGGLRRRRAALPPVPGNQRAHRGPGGHVHQLRPARHAGPGAGGLRRRRAALPPVPGNQRAHRRPGGHVHRLPPARHAGPGPGGLRRRRAALPPGPGNQRAHR